MDYGKTIKPTIAINPNYNLLKDLEKNVRYETGAFHYIGVKKKMITDIYFNAGSWYTDLGHSSLLTHWNNSMLYRFYH
jgi:hypothetical protein